MKSTQNLTQQNSNPQITDPSILFENRRLGSNSEQKLSLAKCVKENRGYFVCVSKYCENQHPYLCNQVDCLCKDEHRHCIHSSIKSFLETIQEKAFPLKTLKDQINQIFDLAIDRLSQKRQTFMLSYEELFLEKSYSVQQRDFLSSFHPQSNKKITGKLMSQIYSTLYDRKDIDKQIIKSTNDLKKLQVEIMKQIEKFSCGIERNLMCLQKNVLGQNKERNFHMFMDSSIILQSSESDKLIKLLNIPIDEAELIFRASTYDFSGKEFHRICEDKHNILVLIRSKYGKVFGGFTPYGFSSYQRDSWFHDNLGKCFIFSLTEGDKLAITSPGYATCNYSHDKSTILKFGDDLGIGDYADKKNSSFTRLYDSYRHEKYQDNYEGYIKFTGSENQYFTIDEWQVWKLN